MQGVGLSVGGYWREVWRRRYFWTALAVNDLRTRYRRSVLGIGWSLLHPIAMTLVLALAFSRIFKINLAEYLPFLMTGNAIWNYICSSVNEGCQTFIRAEGYIRSHNAPLMIYAFRTTLTVVFHFVITLLVTVLFMVCLGRSPFNLAFLTLIPSLVVLFIFGFSVTVLLGFANAYFPDAQHLSVVGLQILFYLTPVMYPPDILEKPELKAVLAWNPLGSFVTLIREPLMYARTPGFGTIAVACILTAALFAAACYVLRRLQNNLVLHL